MKKVVLSLALVAFLGLSLNSCRETANEAGETVEAAEKETEGALEKMGKSVDNAVKETKEAGEAVEDAVDDIDNDDN